MFILWGGYMKNLIKRIKQIHIHVWHHWRPGDGGPKTDFRFEHTTCQVCNKRRVRVLYDIVTED